VKKHQARGRHMCRRVC